MPGPVTVSRELMDSVSGAATGLRDRATGAARDAGQHALSQGQNVVGGAIDRGSQLAHGAVDQAASAAQGALGGAAGGDPADAKAAADEMYDEVLQRLRRDLVVELEQSGHLLRDNP